MTNEKREAKNIWIQNAIQNTAVITRLRVSSLREFYQKNNNLNFILVYIGYSYDSIICIFVDNLPLE